MLPIDALNAVCNSNNPAPVDSIEFPPSLRLLALALLIAIPAINALTA